MFNSNFHPNIVPQMGSGKFGIGSKRNLFVAGCFITALISIAVASGTWTPVAYGVGEATGSVKLTGIISSIVAVISSLSGLFGLFQNQTVVDFGKRVLGDIERGDVDSLIVDSAAAAICTVAIKRKHPRMTEILTATGNLVALVNSQGGEPANK